MIRKGNFPDFFLINYSLAAASIGMTIEAAK